MKYPLSDATANLQGGKFTDGDPANGIPASPDRAAWMNAIYDELECVISASGLTPSEVDNTQVSVAIQMLIDAQSGNYAIDTGAADAYVIALSPAVTANKNGMAVRFLATNSNTGASTLDAGGGAAPLNTAAGVAIKGGDIIGGSIVTAIYDSSTSAWRITTQVASQVQAVPSGHIEASAAIATPSGWLSCTGQAVSRAAYPGLWTALHIAQSGNTTAASAVVTNLSDTSSMGVGMPITGTNIPAGTTIASINSATQLTMSATATANAVATAITVAPWGVGDGSTTFNVPDLRGEFMRGLDMGRGIDAGRVLGTAQADMIKSHTHTTHNHIGTGYGQPTGGNPLKGGTLNSGATGGNETRPRNIAVRYLIKA